MARLFSARTLVLGGLALGAAYALKNKLAGGSQGGTGFTPEPYPGPAPAPAVANADVAGPPENTATAVPAPDPQIHEPGGGIDEAAEEAAAAAEAANIGGVPEEYPSEDDTSVPADAAHRPLEEAGEGYAEGQELAEADLADNAEPAAGDPVDGGRALDDAIEAQDDPFSGETLEEPVPASDTEPLPGDEGAARDQPTLQRPLADVPPRPASRP